MKVIFLRQAYKFIKKADNLLRDKIKEEVLIIQKNPQIGKLLKGKLRIIRSHKFHFKQTSYRIAYIIKNNIIVISVASRENFYRDLRI